MNGQKEECVLVLVRQRVAGGWPDNVATDSWEAARAGMDWIDLAQDRRPVEDTCQQG
jgi:hypothetical protein